MKLTTISSTKLRSNLADSLDLVAQKNTLLITSRGKAEAVLIDAGSYEDLLAASDPAYRESIAQARRDIASGNTQGLEEAFAGV